MRRKLKTKVWDKKQAKFVEVPIAKKPDVDLACSQCRYFEQATRQCKGIGSWFYDREIPYPEYVPKISECKIRLPLNLFAYV
ncbi:MAG: hypothetical protein GF411_05240 [Candidatus Lokiarchaeota archaeon]|nr:hypothetical protein [Candidatus Lokiarchaeota archaeon]